MSTEPNFRRAKPGKKIFDHSPTNGNSGPTSQIPGLSQSAENNQEERTTGRRVGIFDSDSDYTKLAKGGGHKGLLSHDDVEEVEHVTNSSYKASGDWYSGNTGNSGSKTPTSQTSSADSESSNGGRKSPSKGAARPLAPFGTDDISPFDQENDAFTAGKDKVDHAAGQMEKLDLKGGKEAGKYKKISHDKKTAKDCTSMSKLLSFGYMEDETVDDDASSMTSERTSTMAPEDDLE